ncbi:MAG: L-histidine N(alpha)-methyltransferase, partial [Pseudomonadota bacterium]
LKEYYLTRTELALFDQHLDAVAQLLPEATCLIEYGSGSSLKIRKVLQSLVPTAYVPVDISRLHLQDNARRLHDDFPELAVYPVCADITQPFALPGEVEGLAKVAFFPGSSIGNFDPPDALGFLINVHTAVGTGGTLLIGVDRKKQRDVVEAAYNDAEGVTAAFNLNVLEHLNNELDADFDLAGFRHLARYDEDHGRIQMFLQSVREQHVQVANQRVHFARDEVVHTENSYKYHPEEFLSLAAQAGFASVSQYDDDRGWFSLHLLRAV